MSYDLETYLGDDADWRHKQSLATGEKLVDKLPSGNLPSDSLSVFPITPPELTSQ